MLISVHYLKTIYYYLIFYHVQYCITTSGIGYSNW